MSLFIIGHMGLFFYNKIGSIISIVDLPTTNIIEPLFHKYVFFLIQEIKIKMINFLKIGDLPTL
ncbi:hypothetical protein PC0012_14290 [Streptococcus pneumoniae]|nr:hypothetical protein PC0012_14290 [Streptococcus pneumoniae]